MKIETNEIRVRVSSITDSCFCNISNDLHGIVSKFQFNHQIGTVYLASHEEKNSSVKFYVLMVPHPDFRKDLEDDGWEIIADISGLANDYQQSKCQETINRMMMEAKQ